MPEFAFIFRASDTIAPADLPRRNAAAREWALARHREGKLSTASPLEDEGFSVTQQAAQRIHPADAIAAVLIIHAENLDSAVALAKSHPGLAFGTAIEVRPVKSVILATSL